MSSQHRIPEPGEGYRLLDKWEVTRGGTDEYWNSSKVCWIPLQRGGEWANDCNLHIRRPCVITVAQAQAVLDSHKAPPVGDGYRKLDGQDRTQDGDEYWSITKKAWMPVANHQWVSHTSLEFRRPTNFLKGIVDAVGRVLRDAPTNTLVGKGYRQVHPHEEWVLWNDQMWNGKGWITVDDITMVKAHWIVRRGEHMKATPKIRPQTANPPSVGEGYKVLDRTKEVLRWGDEFWNPVTGGWVLITNLEQEPPLNYLMRRKTGKSGTASVSTPPRLRTKTEAHANSPVSHGPGYRFLFEFERTRPGDEIHSDGQWKPVGKHGIRGKNTIRRKVTGPLPLGKGYRFLGSHEMLLAGDECSPLKPGCKGEAIWEVEDHPVWTPVEKRLGRYVTLNSNHAYRRKVVKRAEDANPGEGWRILKPEELLRPGDEYLPIDAINDMRHCNKWTPTGSSGSTVKSMGVINAYRRRLNSEKPLMTVIEDGDLELTCHRTKEGSYRL